MSFAFDARKELALILEENPDLANRANHPNPRGEIQPDVDGLARLARLAGGHLQISKSEQQPELIPGPTEGDPEIYLRYLREHGYRPYGAVATALGWGATRAWQAEAKLRASGRIVLGDDGLRLVASLAAPSENTEGNQA